MWVELGDLLLGEIWADAPDWADALFLEAAYEQCVAFAPALAEGDPVPERYKLAQIYQARALHRSAVAGGGDQLGSEFTVTVFPMDWTVKNLLRPRPGVPVVI